MGAMWVFQNRRNSNITIPPSKSEALEGTQYGWTDAQETLKKNLTISSQVYHTYQGLEDNRRWIGMTKAL